MVDPEAVGKIEWVRRLNPNPYRASAWRQAHDQIKENLEREKRIEDAKKGIIRVGSM